MDNFEPSVSYYFHTKKCCQSDLAVPSMVHLLLLNNIFNFLFIQIYLVIRSIVFIAK